MTITALKRVVVIKGVSIHISTSPSPYPSDVGRHKIAKEAWDILEVTHEGTKTVKNSKLQTSAYRFE